MIFEKQSYYKYISDLEKMVTVSYAIIMIFAVLIGIAGGGTILIITIPLGMFIAYLYNFNTKIKIQEMKMKFDLYEKYIRSSN